MPSGDGDELKDPKTEQSAGQVTLSLELLGCFYKLWVLCVAVLLKRALLLGGYIRARDFWKLPLGFGWIGCEHVGKETSFRIAEEWAWALQHEGWERHPGFINTDVGFL